MKDHSGHSDHEGTLGELLARVLQALDVVKSLKEQQMSQITDWAAGEQVQLDAISGALDVVVTGVKELDKLITDFQNSPDKITAADQEALDVIQAKSQALVAKVKAIDTTAPTPPGGPVVGATKP